MRKNGLFLRRWPQMSVPLVVYCLEINTKKVFYAWLQMTSNVISFTVKLWLRNKRHEKNVCLMNSQFIYSVEFLLFNSCGGELYSSSTTGSSCSSNITIDMICCVQSLPVLCLSFASPLCLSSIFNISYIKVKLIFWTKNFITFFLWKIFCLCLTRTAHHQQCKGCSAFYSDYRRFIIGFWTTYRNR